MELRRSARSTKQIPARSLWHGYSLKGRISFPSRERRTQRFGLYPSPLKRHSHVAYLQYLKENVAAMKIVLTPEEVAHIRKLIVDTDFEGDRYPESMMKLIFSETPAL